ncbi:MAG: DUF6677 family protein [Pirellulales bacterium]
MAPSVSHQTTPVTASRVVAVSPDDGSAIDLKNPLLAALLGWLIPGLGHLYQNRVFKGRLFLITILGTFLFGWWIGGGRVVYYEWGPTDKRFAFIGQAGIGVAAIPAFIQSRLLNGVARQPLACSQWFSPPVRTRQYVSDEYARRLVTEEAAIVEEDFFDRQPLKQFRGDELAIWQFQLGRAFDIGTLYTMLAGMFNVLVVFDAFAGPMGISAKEQKKLKSEKRASSVAA